MTETLQTFSCDYLDVVLIAFCNTLSAAVGEGKVST